MILNPVDQAVQQMQQQVPVKIITVKRPDGSMEQMDIDVLQVALLQDILAVLANIRDEVKSARGSDSERG